MQFYLDFKYFEFYGRQIKCLKSGLLSGIRLSEIKQTNKWIKERLGDQVKSKPEIENFRFLVIINIAGIENWLVLLQKS